MLAGCAGRFDGFAPLPAAVQRPHPQAVPHPARGGGLLDRLDPARSVLPLALAGALVDYRAGVRHGFRDAYDAGFNSVIADPGQPQAAVRAAAEGSRLLVLSDDAAAAEGDPLLLDSRAALLVPVAAPADLGRLAAAVRAAPERPVWALLRAHADPAGGIAMPDPQTARLLAFGALAAGAGGLVWQGEDNYVARNAGLLGIAAAPSLDYGIRTDPASGRQPYRATPADVAASRRLWDAVAQLNRQIARLAPMLLRPDDPQAYTAGIPAAAAGAAPALRLLLKPWDGDADPRRLLLAVNPGDDAVDIRIGFGRAVSRVERWQDDDPEPPETDPARGLLRDRLPPRGVRLYRITY
ncbi:hypothetical protein [Ferrovibrio sp.]|uniref:hypothetical protein n=1 Tax=Ferrovibrio sp. TaxID=1917215 RepID=UPI003511BB40